MFKEFTEYPRQEKFLRHAINSCGAPVSLHGSYEGASHGHGAELQLDIAQPREVHYARKLPPITVRVQPIQLKKATPGNKANNQFFEASVTRSVHKALQVGDRLLGLLVNGQEGLIVNVSNPEEMDYLLETFEDRDCRKQIVL